ncbi:MAG: hypothetical protein JW941_02580 [Candidatus Coatesbacteria bacterium]|nr:hypothetical protein [Candidatus Coatesbacteria bacterium]
MQRESISRKQFDLTIEIIYDVSPGIWRAQGRNLVELYSVILTICC